MDPGRVQVQWSETASDDPFPVVGGQVHARRISGTVAGNPETADVGGYLTGLAQRLQEQGWHSVDIVPTAPIDRSGARLNDSQALFARNAHLVLWVEDGHDASTPQGRLDIHVHRTEPPWISVLTFAGGLLGALLGWLLFGWASRRTEHRRAATTAAGLAVVLGMALLAPALSLGLIFLNVFSGDYLSKVPFWAALAPTGEFGGLAVLSGVAIGTALSTAACCRPDRGRLRVTST
ncbi:hypothetical protein AB0C29_12920 [Actinoplanes sp. NPDC048791]|uniref:hypothetical protein n=1 Tax=Actinoplanes sp. NPDC048791 TaxID=3154623 RepID=UPI0033CD811A